MKKYLKLSFKIFAAFYIFYPLLAEYTVYPPDDDAAFSRIRAGPEASSTVVFVKLFQRFGLGIGCALAGWSNTYKDIIAYVLVRMGSRIPFAKLDLCLLSLHSYFLLAPKPDMHTRKIRLCQCTTR